MATAIQAQHTPEDLLEITDRPDARADRRPTRGARRRWDRKPTPWPRRSCDSIGDFVEAHRPGPRQRCSGQLPDLPRRPQEGPHPRRLLHPPGSAAARDRSRRHGKVAPDLVVEVISPNDMAVEVCIEDPRLPRRGGSADLGGQPGHGRGSSVYSTRRPGTLLQAGDVLDGGDVLPGFQCPVADLFKI